MQLNREFVRTLSPPLSELLPHGEIAGIAKEIGCQPLTVRNAIVGASTNVNAVKAALRSIIRRKIEIEKLLSQVPTETLEEINPH